MVDCMISNFMSLGFLNVLGKNEPLGSSKEDSRYVTRALFESRAGSLLKWGAFISFFLSSISFQPQELQLVFVSIERRKTATHSITGN